MVTTKAMRGASFGCSALQATPRPFGAACRGGFSMIAARLISSLGWWICWAIRSRSLQPHRQEGWPGVRGPPVRTQAAGGGGGGCARGGSSQAGGALTLRRSSPTASAPQSTGC